MTLALSVSYRSAGDLGGQLAELRQQGATLLPLSEIPAGMVQYAALSLTVEVAGGRCELQATVLQAMPGVGLVVQIADPSPAAALAGSATPCQPHAPPAVELLDAAATASPELDQPDDALAGDDHDRDRPPDGARIAGPLSWPIEKLQAQFAELSLPDKVRLARYGKRPARALVMRTQDRTLHTFLLANNGITADEIAALAGRPNADPALLKRIATSPDWLKHTVVLRSLICNPKMSLSEVARLIRKTPDEELRRLAKTGRVRAAVKREIIRYLEHGR